MQTDKQADEHIDIHKQTDVQADRDRHRCMHDIDMQTGRKSDIHTNHTNKPDRQRKTDKQADKHVDIHRQTWLLYGLHDGEKMMVYLLLFTLYNISNN